MLIMIGIVATCFYAIVYYFFMSSHVIEVNSNVATSTEKSDTSFLDTLRSEEDRKKEEIKRREEIKRQQELLVEETYLLEEKERIASEKQAAIESFDSQISTLEEKLDIVRTEKLSFE